MPRLDDFGALKMVITFRPVIEKTENCHPTVSDHRISIGFDFDAVERGHGSG
ncbi:MAG: hypothetical protein R3A47_04110 [Polyangiales bacterium]